MAPTAYTGKLAMCEGAVRGIRAVAVVDFEFEGKHFKREAVVTTGDDDFPVAFSTLTLTIQRK